MEEQTSLQPMTSMMDSLEPEFDVESMEHTYQETIIQGVMEADAIELEVVEDMVAASDAAPEAVTEMTAEPVPRGSVCAEPISESNPDFEMVAESDADETAVNEDVEIDVAEIARMVPDKMAFKIGEVADLTGLKPYVLRYWESEFDALTPQKSAFNQRMYSKRDVETVLLIKKLLYDEKFSIAGAKKKIKELRKELKEEKKRLETLDRFDQAIEMVEDLATEIASFRKLFQLPS